tara:strand:+ start:51043 stop:51744 length:702 start_codon:yes stop_codon:yes gene_type:complete
MSLPGNAFLAMWHDIEPDAWTEYMEWHTREHMPERLSIPGFLVGKRLINHTVERYRYGTIYTGRDVEVFRSPAYLERLNNPTEWSGRVQPFFRNFLRVACDRIASAGHGDGGAMATIRLDLVDGADEKFATGANVLCASLLNVTGAAAVSLGKARNEVSDIKTRETEMRPGMSEEGFDVVVLVEGSGAPELEASLSEMLRVIAKSDLGLDRPRSIVYNLAYQLTANDMAEAAK